MFEELGDSKPCSALHRAVHREHEGAVIRSLAEVMLS